jgi:protein CpxP
MKSLVKLLISVLALGVMASVPMLRAQADPAAPPPPPANGKAGKGGGRGGAMLTVEAIETAVGKLTDDQKTKITSILEKLRTDVAALAQADRRTKGPELRTAAMKDIRALLTPEQQTKFDAMPQPAAGGRRGGKKAGN